MSSFRVPSWCVHLPCKYLTNLDCRESRCPASWRRVCPRVCPGGVPSFRVPSFDEEGVTTLLDFCRGDIPRVRMPSVLEEGVPRRCIQLDQLPYAGCAQYADVQSRYGGSPSIVRPRGVPTFPLENGISPTRLPIPHNSGVGPSNADQNLYSFN